VEWYGRDVDVAGRQVAAQLLQLGVAVHEQHVVLEPELPHLGDQAVPVDVAVVAQDVRVGRAEHDVEQRRVARHQVRQRGDDDLDALVRDRAGRR
jgi:hypothetical protein